MKVLLTGETGQVGWEIQRQAADHGIELVATDRQVLDLSEPESIVANLGDDIDLVINAAAYTAVDKAEEEPDIAHQVNAVAPGLLAARCKTLGIPLIHFSTDYVFDGTATRAWVETDPVGPLGRYGSTKLAGEDAIRAVLDAHIILRTSWVFGVHGQNFVKTMLRLANERAEMNVVADQVGCPTFAGSLAAAALHVAQRIRAGDAPFGTYHYCDDGPTTWHSFATRIIDLADARDLIMIKPRVNPIATIDYPTPAERPAYSVLNIDKFSRTFNEFDVRAWEDGVRAVLDATFDPTFDK